MKRWLMAILAVLALAQAVGYRPSEPFFNGDETRHVMTGIFFRDFLQTMPLGHLREFASAYYTQYPALGLIVWPPMFYGMEGLWMTVFGTSMLAAKLLVLGFALLAVVYVYRLARLSFDEQWALLAALLFAVTPLFFTFSFQVMLEVPALAFALIATFHFFRYLEADRRRDLHLAAAAAVATALTKYDAYYLIPLFVVLIAIKGRWRILARAEVWTAAALAIVAVSPVVYLTIREFGATHLNSIVTPEPNTTRWQHWTFYLSSLPAGIGFAGLIPALAGLAACLFRPESRRRCLLALAIIGTVFLAFAPVEETDPRHVIYWVPAWVMLAVEGIMLCGRARRLPAAFAVAALLLTTLLAPRFYVNGYEEAARLTRDARIVFFDGWLDGDFIYQVRKLDAKRERTVVRGDKLLYHVTSGNMAAGYAEFARDDESMLTAIEGSGAEYLVTETLHPLHQVAGAQRLRAVLRNHPERYERIGTVPVDSNFLFVKGTSLEIYRNRRLTAQAVTSVQTATVRP